MTDFKKLFPALAKQTYLNTASSGLMSTKLAQWRAKQDTLFLEEGANFLERKKVVEVTRKTVSTFFGSSINETALVPNFSFGINTLIEGLPKNKKVLLLENDYPSVAWPFIQRKFDIVYAKINTHLESNIAEAIDKHKPAYFIFSIVQWLSGVKIDLSFLKVLKEKYPNLILIADGTQYVGTEKFNFKESGIDVLGASSYKWLGAGFGTGFMLMKEEVQQEIFPNTIGFNSAENFSSLPKDTTFIKHFEPGHQDALSFGSLNEAIKNLEEVGIEAISEKNQSLSKIAIDGLASLGLLNEIMLQRKQHSSIINFKGDMALFEKLSNAKIICSPRGGGIRVSFHYYNTAEDVAILLDQIG